MPTQVTPARPQRLFGISYSPWTEKARWALEHHGIPYTFSEHTPLIDELPMRLRLRKLRGSISVPTLLTKDSFVQGSLAIARWADANGHGALLERADERAAVDAWDARAERAFEAGRALYSARLRSTPGALEDAVPAFVPEPLRRTVGRIGVAFIARKYGVDYQAEAVHEATLAEVLTALRRALAEAASQSGGALRYLVGGHFTLADIVAACAVNVVVPVGSQYVPIRPRTREAWTRTALALEFGDVISWRDALYARHRRDGAGPSLVA